jgi:hypothetical protein
MAMFMVFGFWNLSPVICSGSCRRISGVLPWVRDGEKPARTEPKEADRSDITE